MNAQDFCYWLQGRAELLPDQPPTADEWKMIREHLALTFKKVTPTLPRIFEDGAYTPAYPPYPPYDPFRQQISQPELPGRITCKPSDLVATC